MKPEPCPRCGGKTEYTNSRDLDVLQSYMQCTVCTLTTFAVESMAFMMLLNLDAESTLMKYNAWCATLPTQYCEERWEVKNEKIS